MSKVTLIAPLNRIACATPVDLGSGVEIHTYNRGLEDFVNSAKAQGMVRNPDQFSPCLVVKDIDDQEGGLPEMRSALEEVVLRLRLHKAGSIGFSVVIVDRGGWYEKLLAAKPGKLEITFELIGVLFYTVWTRPGFHEAYELLPEDVAPITELLAHTRGLELMRKPAFRYFFAAIMNHTAQIDF